VKRLCDVSFPAHKEMGTDNRTNEGILADDGFVNKLGVVVDVGRRSGKELKGLDDFKTKQEGGERGGEDEREFVLGGAGG
jgi:hypothetical protein